MRLMAVVALVVALPAVLPAAPTTVPVSRDDWKSLDEPGLRDLARSLRAKGAIANNDCLALAAVVTERFQSACKAGGMQWTDPWLDTAVALCPFLDASVRDAMAEDIRKSLVANEAAVKPLVYDNLMKVGQTLNALGHSEMARSTYAAWLTASDQVQQLDAGRLANLLISVGADGKAARSRAVALMSGSVLPDKARTRAMGALGWASLVNCLKDELTGEQRPAWAKALRAAFAEDPAATGKLKLVEMQAVATALKTLGDGKSADLEGVWVASTDQWQAAGWYDRTGLALRLAALGEAGKPGRIKMQEWVSGQWLSSPAKAREVRPEDWRKLAQAFAQDLAQDARAPWIKTIRGAFVEDAATLDTLKYSDIQSLVEFLRLMGEQNPNNLFAEWIEKSQGWTKAQLGDLYAVSNILTPIKTATAARKRLIVHLSTTCLADRDKTKQVKMQVWNGFALALIQDMDGPARALWASKLQDAYGDYKVPGDNMTQAQLSWTLQLLAGSNQ